MNDDYTGGAPKASLTSKRASDPATEHEKTTPGTAGEAGKKIVNEARGEEGVVEKIKAAGREIDRLVGGEYERREDEKARPD